MPASTLLIVGSGPGIALQTALLFATKGFTDICLIARSESNLATTKSTILASSPSLTISTFACDVADSASLTTTLTSIQSTLHGAPEVILFNAAHVAPSDIASLDSSSLLTSDFTITTTALHAVAATFIPAMLAESESLPKHKPTLLVTGGHVSRRPFPPVFSLSVAKAAQYNLSESLAMVYGPKGLHVATVVINGVVRGEEGEMSASSIAGVLGRLYEEGNSRRKGEMSVRDVGRVEDFLREMGASTD